MSCLWTTVDEDLLDKFSAGGGSKGCLLAGLPRFLIEVCLIWRPKFSLVVFLYIGVNHLIEHR